MFIAIHYYCMVFYFLNPRRITETADNDSLSAVFISIPQIGAVSSFHTLYSERKPLYRIQLDLQVRIKKKYHDLRNSSNFKSKSLKKTCTKSPLSLLRNLKLIDPTLYIKNF